MNDEVEDKEDAKAQRQEATEGQGKALVPLQERRINFHGDELVVVLVEIEGERQVYVPVRQFCDYLGLNWSAQYRRIGRDEELRDATTSVAITATLVSDQRYKQRYNAICLQLEMLPGWLFGVTPSRVKPEYQERIRLYRKKCYRVLWDAFLRGELFPEEGAVVVPSTVETAVVPSDDPRINALTEQIDTLTAIVAFLREHRQALVEEAGQVRAVIEAGQQELLQRADHISGQLAYVVSLLEQLIGRQTTTEVQVAKIDARTQRLTPVHGPIPTLAL